ncbi:integrase core domain-containing protein [Asaia sp. As-1742]|nr:integrase core domain-containing protein [Asaia sp. As-1742]NIE81755.1 transposase [Asaia sp. As-1742]
MSLDDACVKMGAWRQGYNEDWPHSSIGNMPPDRY